MYIAITDIYTLKTDIDFYKNAYISTNLMSVQYILVEYY